MLTVITYYYRKNDLVVVVCGNSNYSNKCATYDTWLQVTLSSIKSALENWDVNRVYEHRILM